MKKKAFKPLSEADKLACGIPNGAVTIGTKKGALLGEEIKRFLKEDEFESAAAEEGRAKDITERFERLNAADRVKAWTLAMRDAIPGKKKQRLLKEVHDLVTDCFGVPREQEKKTPAIAVTVEI